MKFNKAVLININESALDASHWKQLDSFIPNRISLSPDNSEIMKEIADADCLLVGFATDVTKEMIDQAQNLKYIGILATAYGKVDVEYAKQKGVPVTNLAGYSTEAVAEFTIATILESMRQLTEGRRRSSSGNYSTEGMRVTEIKGRKFGVIGLGRIGSRVAEIAAGFGANVMYWDRTKKDSLFTYVQDIDQLIKESDIISLNLSQNAETNGIINAKRIESLKPGMIFVKTVSMDLIDVDALEKRLQKNDITFIMENSGEASEEIITRLSKYPNCIIYPPLAYMTDEAKLNRQEIFIANVESFLNGKPINIVNL